MEYLVLVCWRSNRASSFVLARDSQEALHWVGVHTSCITRVYEYRIMDQADLLISGCHTCRKS